MFLFIKESSSVHSGSFFKLRTRSIKSTEIVFLNQYGVKTFSVGMKQGMHYYKRVMYEMSCRRGLLASEF